MVAKNWIGYTVMFYLCMAVITMVRINYTSEHQTGYSIIESAKSIYGTMSYGNHVSNGMARIPHVASHQHGITVGSDHTSYINYTAKDHLLAKMIVQRYNNISYIYALNIAHYINKYTKGLAWPDPVNVAAIIEIESQYDQNALSDCGAKGLMQVSPMWSNKVPPVAYTSYKYNIKYGIRILSYYYKMYDGNISAAILSYNSGNRAYNEGKAWPTYWYRYMSAKKAFDNLYQMDV